MRNNRIISAVAAACAMLAIILDTKTALVGAQEGIALCLKTVIPSLFPFFILGGIINSRIIGRSISVLRPLGRLCGIPQGSESLLVVGLIAGYPIGAQLITEAYKNGSIPKQTAKRMLGFCNNAGPAFLFGMLSPLFSTAIAPWLLWSLHILTAIAVACIIPGRTADVYDIKDTQPLSLPKSIQIAMRAMADVCGWVIVFRVVLAFCGRWFLWRLPTDFGVLFSGLMELSNGCVQLKNIPSEGLRFILADAMLAAGGFCVGMQTVSVTDRLGTGWYFPGKLLQCLLSVSVSCFVQPLVFSDAYLIPSEAFFILISVTAIYIYIVRRKKEWHLRKKYCIIEKNIP